MEAHIDWDTDNAQDRSRTPSPSVGIGTITLGESAEDTPPARQNICLVLERCRPRKIHLKQRICYRRMKMMPLLMNNNPSLGCEGDIVHLYVSTEEL